MTGLALLLALKTIFDPAAAADATFALGIDGDWFAVTVAVPHAERRFVAVPRRRGR